jgi:hypothetical protein
MKTWKKQDALKITKALTMGKNSLLKVINSDNTTSTIDLVELANIDSVVDSDGNTALGITALDSRTAGSALDNTALGNAAGTAITTGDDNTLIGEDAGSALVTASDATAVGSGALAASTAEGNTAVGAAALGNNVTGLRNVAVGLNAGSTQAGATDDDNVWIGHDAGKVATGSASGGNVAVGSTAMDASTTSIDCTAVGFNALGAQVTGNSNTAIGADAMATAAGATDDNCVAVGFEALTAMNGTASGDNTAVGAGALKAAVTTIDATAVGKDALAASTANGNTAVGARALDANVTGLRNVAVGEDAGGAQAGATDDDNTFIGYNAGLLANGSASGGNVAIGSLAMDAATTAIDCTAVGFNALGANVTGNANVAVGSDALLVAAGATDDDSVAVGTGALRAMNGSASGENTAVGSEAGATVTTGVNNTVVGRLAGGTTLTTGTGNTVVGADSTTSAAGSIDQIVLGRGVTGVADAAITLGNGTRAITCNYDADQTWDAPSDLRMKNVHGDSRLGLSFINRLSPIEYTFKPVSEWPEEWGIDGDEPLSDKRILGLGAQDVKAAMDAESEIVFHGWDENAETGQQMVGESAFVYPLINAVNELTAMVSNLEAKIKVLEQS